MRRIRWGIGGLFLLWVMGIALGRRWYWPESRAANDEPALNPNVA